MRRGPVMTDVLERALERPPARRYHPLLSQGAFSLCGPTSVGNVLRSLGVDRGTNPFPRHGLRPMSLEQLTHEAAGVVPEGWRVEAVRVDSLDALRAELVASNRAEHRYIANFSRRPLFGRGGGHHSPLGGYLEAEDLALVLDVNRGYGPWLCPPHRLLEALCTVDRGDGRSRGLVRFTRTAAPGPAPTSSAPPPAG